MHWNLPTENQNIEKIFRTETFLASLIVIKSSLNCEFEQKLNQGLYNRGTVRAVKQREEIKSISTPAFLFKPCRKSLDDSHKFPFEFQATSTED